MQEITFGSLLKKYRLLAGFKTLKQLADALTDEGLIYSESLLSRWQKNSRLPKDRDVFLILIKILVAHRAIKNVYQANQFLSLAGMGYLSPTEVSVLLKKGDLDLEINLLEKPNLTLFDLEFFSQKYLSWLSEEYKSSGHKI